MHSSATFEVTDFTPTDYVSPIATGTPIGQASITKVFTGDIEGRSVAQFCGAYDEATASGSYVALEAFEGTVAGRRGTFAFAHTNTTGSTARPEHHLLVVVPGSGTDELAGISGGGTLLVDDDGTHRLTLDVELPQ